ncbi:flagellin [Aurantimonas sp. 22II-16-19i]|uniref:flagellin N-terminal helical domain-containing protein n=1 Tax=Aurantimonas sp. 22II-16-19i TaxID=1317114 RepID=UPI0009F7F0BA|nr:flagellin [Aurantimonas sp. 22II-16-19i]ORE95060.1 Flagellin A [Aurantimonas sp. 22II-16-19i]
MTSIITNTSAMTALQSLQSINNALDTTQGRISTGYRVSEAQDNAAYWSIATTMRADNNALSAVSDSLGIGAATVDAAYTGLNSAKDRLDTIKAKLTTATSDGVDKSKVQSEITALQGQLQTIAESASFSGQNWLSTGSSTALSKEIVSSIARDATGSLTVGSIAGDITSVRLFSDNGAGVDTGILNKTIDLTKYTNTAGVATTVETTAVSFAAADDLVTFSVKVGGAAAKTVEITDQTLLDAGLTDTTIRSNADLAAVLTQALKDADITGIDVSIDGTDNVVLSSTDTFSLGDAAASGTTGITAASLGLNTTAATTTSASAGAAAVDTIDITSASVTDIKNFIKVVDEALSQVTSAASSLGAIQNRIDMQTDFVSKLMDTVSEGVGSLVDADMTEESTRLKALQTQQQLGVQALSIANSSSESLLSLFR